MSYDLIVIGSGPGGYVCAIRAAQLGLKVAMVEKRATYGGTCLNIGCIPSKALLHASHLFHEATHEFAHYGIVTSPPALDLDQMMTHKDETVAANVNGVAFLLKKNKIDGFIGTGSISAVGKVQVVGKDGKTTLLEARAICIATGSEPIGLPNIAIDEETIVSSTGALAFKSVPKNLVVVGGGVIGLEIGSIWQRLGAKVTVVEFLDRIIAGMDGEIAKSFQRFLERQGFTFLLGQKVSAIALKKSSDRNADKSPLATVTIKPASGGAPQTLEADAVLIAVGRRPFTDGLGLQALGVALERGRIVTDAHFATSIPGIYAIGDVINGPMLAHKAEDEGVALAEMLAGQKPHINYDLIPSIIYTMPEVASIGKTEEELKAAGVAYKVGKFPMMANGRARAMRQTDGFVKILADSTTDRVLGAHIIAASAGDLIHEIAVLMEFGGSAEDLARTCHGHPTLSEAVREAALAVDKRALHV